MTKISIVINEDYNKGLRARLEKYAITQAELAREMGITPQQISHWIMQGRVPRMANIVKIETAILNIRRRRQGREPLA